MAFEQGVSGNAKGRPTNAELARKGVPNSKLRALLKRLEKSVPDAVDELVNLMNDPKTPPTVRAQAAKTLLTEYKSVYEMLEAPAKSKYDTEENDELPLAPVVDFSNIQATPEK